MVIESKQEESTFHSIQKQRNIILLTSLSLQRFETLRKTSEGATTKQQLDSIFFLMFEKTFLANMHKSKMSTQSCNTSRNNHKHDAR